MPSGVKSVGRYELLNELGRGAMGVVYKARDPKIDRLVAIKTISIFAHTPEEDREFRERLVTEAKAAGRLSHPGIVTVYDVGEDPDTLNPYIVMEYVAGDSLEKQVAESADRFPLGSTLVMVEQVAEALDYAHSQGIVHRDIKPANILLPENGPPKITDFGIAKFNFGHHTSLNEGMGTPAFMSPEQLNGEAVDGRSDLFSLGVVLYTLLTGYRPFQGNSALTVQFKVVNRNPLPATAFDSAFPPELDHVVFRAMAKDPADRYPTGREMAADIRTLREAFGQAPGSEDGSFDAVYLQTASKVVNPTLSQKALSTIIKKPATRPSKSTSAWLDWRYLSAGALTIAILALALLIVERRYSISIASQPAPTSELSSGAVQQSSPSNPSSVVSTETAEPSSPLRHAKTRSRPVSSRNIVRARSANVSTISSGPTTQQVAMSTRSEATLRLRIEDKFEQAEVFLWIDDKLAYDRSVGGSVKKKMIVFKGVEGHQSDSLRLAPGEHRFRVRVHAADDSYDQTGTLTAALPTEGERQLLIQCEKHKPVRLTLQ